MTEEPEVKERVGGHGRYLDYLRGLWMIIGQKYAKLVKAIMYYQNADDTHAKYLSVCGVDFATDARLIYHEFRSIEVFTDTEKISEIGKLKDSIKGFWSTLIKEDYDDKETRSKMQENVEEIMDLLDEIKGRLGGIMDIKFMRKAGLDTKLKVPKDIKKEK